RSAGLVDRAAGRVSVCRRRALPRARAPHRLCRGQEGRRCHLRAEDRCRESRARCRVVAVAQRRSEEEPMIELYSIRDVARILAVQESRWRYWMQPGFVGPTVRKGGRFYYTFCDLVAVKSAKDLLAADVPLQKARKAVEGLRKALPAETNPTSRL